MASVLAMRNKKKEAAWRGHVRAQARSGLSVAAYCRRQGLPEHGFYWWRRALVRRDEATAEAAVMASGFVPVRVVGEKPAAEPGGSIEIVLPGDRCGGRRVRVTGGAVDRRMLMDVLSVMESLEQQRDVEWGVRPQAEAAPC